MASPLSVACPHCDASLKLKSREAEGKKVKCPKCEKPFVIKLPAEEESSIDEWDSYSSEAAAEETEEEEQEEEAEAPPARRASSRSSTGRHNLGKKKKKSAPANWQRPLMTGLAALMVLALLGGAIIGVAHLLPLLQGQNKIDLAWLPHDVETVIVIRVADLANSPLAQGLKANPAVAQGLDSMKQESGLEIGDIVSMTIGTPKLSSTSGPPKTFEQGFKMGSEMTPLTVIRTSKPIDSSKYAFSGRKPVLANHEGHTYFKDTQVAAPGKTMAVYFATDTTLLVGIEGDVQAAIKRGAKAP